MDVSTQDIKKLRNKTGAGILECKKALENCEGDMDGAVTLLRKKGAAVAKEKGERVAAEGIIGEYLHFNKKLAVIVELNCETDFVAKNEQFVEFSHELAKHIAACNPGWISSEDVPEDVLEKEEDIYREQLKDEGKPDNIIDKIIEGKLNKFYEENCLLDQNYFGDDSINVQQAIEQLVQSTGEKIKVSRFVRYEIGEENE